jgi:putative transposase
VELDLAPQVQQALVKDWEPMYRSQLHYLVTWNTRARRPVLKERHVEALKSLIRQACEDREIELVEVVAGQDHIHVLFGLRPAQSVASAVRELKGRTSMMLFQSHPELRVWLRGNLLWDERYMVETVSPLRVQKLKDRLANAHRSLFGEDPELWAPASGSQRVA